MADHEVFLERALVEEGLLTGEELDAARRYGTEHGVDLVDALVKTETLTSRQIALTKADICEVPYVELSAFETTYTNTAVVARSIAERHCVFPLFMVDGVLTLAMDDPLDLQASDQVRRIAKCEVDAVLCPREEIKALIAKAYTLGHRDGPSNEAVAVETEVEAGDASQPVIAAVNEMLADAVAERASDIHLNPDEHDLHVRYRIDGVLHQKQGPSLSMHQSIVQRLKVMAQLDLTQTRRPQDGKFRFRQGGTKIDVRLSTIPTVCGENVVMRLLANAQTYTDFLDLGIPAPLASEIDEMILNPYGMMLVTGPTGSGKTTTLYTVLNKLNDPSRNIMTIEDPVEIRLPYVRQVQVNHEINMTFAAALRSILRQDPDVVLLGEIRDNETATIALQAALTGHLVLSTLHTNDACGAVARLRDYGLPSFVINTAVLGVLAQRLVRRVCGHCAGPDELHDLVRHRFSLPVNAEGFVKGRGCSRCGKTGYRGRLGIYELLPFTNEVKRLVESGGSVDRVRELAVRNGMRLMWQDGLEKARLGHTTLDEVTKVSTIGDTHPQEAAPIATPSRKERMIA